MFNKRNFDKQKISGSREIRRLEKIMIHFKKVAVTYIVTEKWTLFESPYRSFNFLQNTPTDENFNSGFITA